MPGNRFLWPALVLATILFWSIPLFQPNATIHWDLADVAYPEGKGPFPVFPCRRTKRILQ